MKKGFLLVFLLIIPVVYGLSISDVKLPSVDVSKTINYQAISSVNQKIPTHLAPTTISRAKETTYTQSKSTLNSAPKIIQAQRDTCEETITGVRGMFNSRSYRYDASCQDNSWFTYNCGSDGRYRMEQQNCGSRGCNNNGCIVDTCEETENGVRGMFNGRSYTYAATCQGNLLFTYTCGNEGRYSMQQTNCGTTGCSNGKCNIDTCQETSTGVRGVFRGQSYNYNNKCQDNSWFIYNCGGEGRYSMQQDRCEENESCDDKKGCVKKGISSAPVKVTIQEQKIIIPTIAQKPLTLTTTLRPKETIIAPSKEIVTPLPRLLPKKTPDSQPKIDLLPSLASPSNEARKKQLLKEIQNLERQQKEISIKLKQLRKELAKLEGTVPSSDKKVSIQELNKYVKDLEEQLNSVGENQQLSNVDLQNELQKMQQTLQTLSNVAKSSYDTTMSVVRNQAGLTSEESQNKEKKVSRQGLNNIIKNVEAQQQALRDRRQMALTYFQSADQRANQLNNMISSILRTMNEARGLGTSSRSNALTSEERENRERAHVESQEVLEELQENRERAREEHENVLGLLRDLENQRTQAVQRIAQATTQEERNVMEELLEILKESIEDANKDREYYLEKLETYNKMGKQLTDYLSDLVDKSTELSQASADAPKKISHKLDNLQGKSRIITDQLEGLKGNKSKSQRLVDLNKELNSVSTSRKLISDILKETMQTQEEIAETTKSILDSKGRVVRQVSRFEG